MGLQNCRQLCFMGLARHYMPTMTIDQAPVCDSYHEKGADAISSNNSGDDPKHQKLKSDWTEIRWYWNELISFIYESSKRKKKKKNDPQTKINILCYEDFECIGIFFHNIFTFSRHYWKSHRFYFRKGTSLFSSMNKAWRRIKDEKDQCSYHTKISSFQITLQNSFKECEITALCIDTVVRSLQNE